MEPQQEQPGKPEKDDQQYLRRPAPAQRRGFRRLLAYRTSLALRRERRVKPLASITLRRARCRR